MYHVLISMPSVCPERANGMLFEREPPEPPGEPTTLNKERVGQSTEALRRRTGTVRERSSW
jgi:hypothetical protein